MVDPGTGVRVGAVGEQQLDSCHVVSRGCIVQRRPVVDAALLDVRAGREQELDELVLVRPGAGQGGDQRREPGVVLMVRIGAELEQRADEGERTV